MLTYPTIDPVMIHLGPFAIRWYAIAYIIGLFGGWGYFKHLDKKDTLLDKLAFENILMYTMLGVVLGGRFGYVLFYNLPHYLEVPSEILKIWHGGMSFHGGVIGVILALYIFARTYKVPYLRLMDKVVCVVPIGLFCGRIANFINGELFGRPTDVYWGMIFPTADASPRHPSQLYEATLEGLVLFCVLSLLFYRTKLREMPGVIGGVFLLGYGLARAAIEPFREPDVQLGTILGPFTMGQLLSTPMLVLGIYLIIQGYYDRKKLSI